MMVMELERPALIELDPLVARERPIRKPLPEEILIQVSACGVCHTDLHIVEGELPPHRLPLIPGHQIVGRVSAIPESENDFKKGDLVGVPWLHTVCKKCDYCQRGQENLCNTASFTGYDVDGGYAEYVTVNREAVYHLPFGYADEELAPLLCGGVIGYRAYQAAGLRKGDVLGLFGFGSSAHLVLQMALHDGLRVYVVTRSPEHQKLAKKLGADFAGSIDDRLPRPLRAAILFAPVGDLVVKALSLMEKGGRVIHAGIYSSPLPGMDYSLIYGERVITSVTNSTRNDVKKLLEFAEKMHFHIQTETYSLSEANQVLQLLKQSRIKASAVLKT
jgi:propanol-preferring alcohol dehydrogenase